MSKLFCFPVQGLSGFEGLTLGPVAGMPQLALPQGFRKGRLSYTVTSHATGAKVEVLLKQKAFRITLMGQREGC